MCGIIGRVGTDSAAPYLLEGLKRLEYRGYDSAGIAVLQENKIECRRALGRLDNLCREVNGNPADGNVGIGHTRWATHGNPTDVNAHPQVSSCGKIALVHNGIIENYIELKQELIDKGFSFKSDTDTEVIVQLMSSLYKGDIFQTVKDSIKKLHGSFALGIICTDNPDLLIAVKKDSPLIIGTSKNENYIASDIPALLSKTNTICRLQEKQIALITPNEFKIYDFDGNLVENDLTVVNWSVDAAEKNQYEHFMLKEIMEQPKAIKDTISPRIEGRDLKIDNLNFSKEYLESLNKICIVACGSAYHVGCTAKYFMELLLRKPVEVDLASEFRYRSPIVDKNTLVIIISQSGETADSLAALRESKRLGARVLSIVNVVGSSIASESDDVLYTHAGPEIAVATTKAYSTQLALMYILAIHIGKVLNKISDQECTEITESLKLLPENIKTILENKEEIMNIAKNYHSYEKVFFIGRNVDYAICMEGSLKLKEISYIHSEAYAAGELKHGTISLIDENTLVIAIATQEKLIDKMISNVREVKARGAKVLFLTTEKYYEKLKPISDCLISVPQNQEIILPSLSIISLQLISYYIAKFRGCNIDKPRNLAKSVTVE